jgi:hypothetical protein
VKGFEVWISTASHQYIVDAISHDVVGIPSTRVIGVRTVLQGNKITTSFQGCGEYPASQNVINYRLGKRCWINKLIFEYPGSRQLTDSSPLLFAAGDSDADAYFLRDAVGLRIVINRNEKELMCNGLENIDDKWIIQPMFIEPLPVRTKAYECSDVVNVSNSNIQNQLEAH